MAKTDAKNLDRMFVTPNCLHPKATIWTSKGLVVELWDSKLIYSITRTERFRSRPPL